jgi:hypothetical protein
MGLATPPLFGTLAGSRSVLIAGAGGGFDVYAGLPLAFALQDSGARVHLANLSFTHLELIDLGSWLAENLAAITPPVAASSATRSSPDAPATRSCSSTR